MLTKDVTVIVMSVVQMSLNRERETDKEQDNTVEDDYAGIHF